MMAATDGKPRRLTYSNVTATLALALALGAGTAYAAPLIGPNQIADDAIRTRHIKSNQVLSRHIGPGQVTSSDIADGAVAVADLAERARGARVVRYDLGDFDFATGSFLSAQLPSTWDAATVAGSTWTMSVHQASLDRDYLLPGMGVGGATTYRISVTSDGHVFVDKVGPGEAYTDIRLYRTIVPSAAGAPRVVAPRTTGSARSSD